MNMIEVIKNRRSIRKFKQQEILDADLIDLIDCARLAPSAANGQPLEYIIIKNPEKKEDVFKTTNWAGNTDRGVPSAFIVVLADNKRVSQWQAVRDAAASIENILLSAQAKGIGSCWIISADMDRVREILEIDEKYTIDSLIALGYSAEESVVEDISDKTKYWKDDNGVTHVPKRPLNEVYTIRK